jgi:DNA-binding IclR family transcriptional regulator
MGMRPSNHSKAPALSRGREILEFIAIEERALSFTFLKSNLNIPGPSLWRLLMVLKESGYVLCDAQTHAYRLGYRFLYMGSVLLQQVIEKIGLPSITKFTLRSFGVLKKELKKIRSQGYAVDDQEMRLGVFRIASPVFDQDGKIIACLGVAGPSFRLNRDKQKSIGVVSGRGPRNSAGR